MLKTIQCLDEQELIKQAALAANVKVTELECKYNKSVDNEEPVRQYYFKNFVLANWFVLSDIGFLLKRE